MEIYSLSLPDVWLITSPIFEDHRGTFSEWFKFSEISRLTKMEFSPKQANISLSNKGALRGIHYSLEKEGQAKLVKCISGKIVDVIVDIRPDSPSFKNFVKIELSAGDGKTILIGKGLGHGFLSLENDSVVSYLLDSPYSPAVEFEINPFDPELGIDWGTQYLEHTELLISEKDQRALNILELLDLDKLPRINS